VIARLVGVLEVAWIGGGWGWGYLPVGDETIDSGYSYVI